MSLSDTYFRHLCILRKLQKTPAALQDIKDYYEAQCETHGYHFVFSNRTFLRDKEDILSLYKKDIRYDASTRKYYLEEEEVPDDFGNRITDAYNTYLALNMADDVAAYVHLEKRRPQGMEQFNDLLTALRDRFIIRFNYEKYYEQHFSEREAEPLALKEFESRWYVLAKDMKDKAIKTFALDRISNLELSKLRYKPEKGFDVNKYFKHCFGITRPAATDMQPEDILLSFKGDRGKYIKSLPLHESQRIVTDNDHELRISLKLYITHDLVMELLSHGDEVEVLRPETLRLQMQSILNRTGNFYTTTG